MAEIDFNVPARARLRERDPDEASLETAANACVSERNAVAATIDWRFTAKDARTKLHCLYPCHSCLTRYLDTCPFSSSSPYVNSTLCLLTTINLTPQLHLTQPEA